MNLNRNAKHCEIEEMGVKYTSSKQPQKPKESTPGTVRDH